VTQIGEFSAHVAPFAQGEHLVDADIRELLRVSFDLVEDRHRLAVAQAHDHIGVLGYEVEDIFRLAALLREHRLDGRWLGHCPASLDPPAAPATSATFISNRSTRSPFSGATIP